MPTVDEEGPKVLDFRVDRAVTGADVLRSCAIDAHEDWQAALEASTAALRAARTALGTGREAYMFERASALHEAAKRAERTYTHARERWFSAAPEKAAIYRRRFKFGDCLASSDGAQAQGAPCAAVPRETTS